MPSKISILTLTKDARDIYKKYETKTYTWKKKADKLDEIIDAHDLDSQNSEAKRLEIFYTSLEELEKQPEIDTRTGCLKNIVTILNSCTKPSAENKNTLKNLLETYKTNLSAVKWEEAEKDDYTLFSNNVIHYCYEYAQLDLSELLEISAQDKIILLDTHKAINESEHARGQILNALNDRLGDITTLNKQIEKLTNENNQHKKNQIDTDKELINRKQIISNLEKKLSYQEQKTSAFEKQFNESQIHFEELKTKYVQQQNELAVIHTNHSLEENKEHDRLQTENNKLTQELTKIKNSQGLAAALNVNNNNNSAKKAVEKFTETNPDILNSFKLYPKNGGKPGTTEVIKNALNYQPNR